MQTDVIQLNLAHSPDSDDLVMWWPLVGVRHPDGTPVEGDLGHPQVDIGPFKFNLVARDVEELNKLVVGRQDADAYDITAISCAAYPAIADRYAITAGGGSFGENYGPRVVVREDSTLRTLDDLLAQGGRIAIPGVNTSAYLTLRMAAGSVETQEMLFSDIPGAVARGEADAGLLIHEAQLTYGQQQLREIGDMGKWWHTQAGKPLPLGLNVIRKDLDERFGAGTCIQLAGVLNDSVRCCVRMGEASRQYLQLNRGDRTEWDDPQLVDRYLEMYVSGLTLDMGDVGRDAIATFLGRGAELGLCSPIENLTVL